MTTSATDGQNPGQAAPAAEEGGTGGGPAEREPSVADLKAEIGILADSMSEMRQAFLSSRSPAPAPQVEEEIDDDAPVTSAKLKRVVRSTIAEATAQSDALNQRQQWDDRAKREFPLHDPKFLREFQQEFRKQTAAGLNANHPKAVYTVAEIVARTTGAKKAPTRDASETQTAETSSNPPPRQRPGGSKSSISDDDPRVRFYAMRNGGNKEKMEAYKAKLSEKEAGRRSR